ncbi:BTAD domain-containing putative transcriptional regulator [Micromonospora sp. WMMD736]|uniref:AfsR/SARP family transcriptional regulator n=1 Tax=Micromonospora sp. WMMD736 TaxID=3404112 RepID=UPI003B955ACC
MPLELRVLGPIEVRQASQLVVVGRRMHRLLLGLLGLHANSIVATDDLVDLLWPQERVPRSARSMIHSRISELRAALAKAGLTNGQISITSNGDGYAARLDPMLVDAHRFRLLVRRSRDTQPALSWPDKRRLLREAVGLWRGSAFGGWAPHRLAPPEVQALEEARLTALEHLYQAELRAGTDASSLIEELMPLARQHPSREPFTLHLMHALVAGGRSTDALDCYERHRRWLAEELGTDPCEQLQQLHLDILRTPPTELPTTPRQEDVAGPAQLPAEPEGFVGRQQEQNLLDAAIAETGARTVVLVGPAGVGKTALALRWAHGRLRQAATPAHLYADLRGNGGITSLPANLVLERFLRALGVDGDDIPADPEERASRYRSALTRRATLIVLDNAASSSQVRPLLPGAGDHLLLVTSRHRMDGLVATNGATRLLIGPLTERDAHQVLGNAIDDRRAVLGSQLARISDLCDRLPLALRIASALLNNANDARLLADELASEGNRLGLLSAEDISVRAALAVTLAGLSEPTRRLFALLGRHPGPRPSLDACIALTARSEPETRASLDELIACHLVQPLGSDRYLMHDLVRLFAAEQAATEADSAAHSLLTWYRDVANAADRVLRPKERPNFESPKSPVDFTDSSTALGWLSAEADNLSAAVERAEETYPQLAWQIAAAMYGWLVRQQERDRWIELYLTAVRAARRSGDPAGEALLSSRLAIPLSLLGRHDEAAGHCARAYELRNAMGDRLGAATASLNLAAIENIAGRPTAAIRQLRLAEEQGQGLPNALHLRALIQSNLGEAHQLAGQHPQAAGHYREALLLAETACGPRDVAEILVGLSRVHHGLDEPEQAIRYGERALAQARLAGDVLIAAEAQEALGRVKVNNGEVVDGLANLRSALAVYAKKGHRDTAKLSRLIGAIESTP